MGHSRTERPIIEVAHDCQFVTALRGDRAPVEVRRAAAVVARCAAAEVRCVAAEVRCVAAEVRCVAAEVRCAPVSLEARISARSDAA
jgi:hypothetical protein